MKNNQPIYLNLFRIKLPIAGIVSLLHRVSGVFLIIGIPFALYYLQLSLLDENNFQQLVSLLDSPFLVFLEVILFGALAYHLFAGIRFLLLDIDVGLNKRTARYSSWLVIAVTALSTLIFTVLRVIS